MSDYTKAAEAFLDVADPENSWFKKRVVRASNGAEVSVWTIEEDIVDEIVNEVMSLLAEIHAQLINVGSEREAIMEDDPLREGVEHAFSGWEMGDAPDPH